MTWASMAFRLAATVGVSTLMASVSGQITVGTAQPTPQTFLTENSVMSSIAFTVELITALTAAAGDTITFTSNADIWSFGNPTATECTGTDEGTAFSTFLPVAISTKALRIGISADMAAGVSHTYVFTCTTNLASISAGLTAVTIATKSSQDTTELTGQAGWTPGFQITAASFANDPSTVNPVANVAPTSMTFSFTLPNTCTNGEKLFISGTETFLDSGTGNPTCTFSPAPSPAAVCVASSDTLLEVTPDAAAALPASAQTLQLTNNLKYHTAFATTQSFTLRCGAATSGAAGSPSVDMVLLANAYQTLTAEGTVAGDPITYFGDHRTEFNLPTGGVLTSLLEVPDMHVSASSFVGNHAGEQWIDRVVVTTSSGEKVTDISIKKDLTQFDRNKLPKNAFETLDVVMWDHVKAWQNSIDARPTELSTRPMHNEYFRHPKEGLSVMFAQGRHCRNQSAHIPCQECSHVVGKFAKILICASSAHEYYNSGYGAYKYAHLDLEFFDLRMDLGDFKGVLPEIWGITPRSNETQAMIKSQVQIEKCSTEKCTGVIQPPQEHTF